MSKRPTFLQAWRPGGQGPVHAETVHELALALRREPFGDYRVQLVTVFGDPPRFEAERLGTAVVSGHGVLLMTRANRRVGPDRIIALDPLWAPLREEPPC